jgi:hypothetical protein
MAEYVKECVMKAAEIVCPEKQQFFKITIFFFFFVNTVAEHRNDLGGATQCQLKEKCKSFVVDSIATDESTDVKIIAQLVIFKR